MEISIIVPVYNASKTIKRSIDSILTQSYRDFELILVDDGSTDNSLEICRSYSDNRMIIISMENHGVSHARNVGMRHAKGRYITFCDADDYYSPDRLEESVSAARTTKADIVICGHYTVDPDGITVECNEDSGFIDKNSVVKSMMFNDNIGGFCWNKLFKADVIRNAAFPTDLTHLEDTYFFFSVLREARSMYYLAKPLYYYSNDSGSSATQDMRKLISSDNRSRFTIGYSKILNDFSPPRLIQEYLVIMLFRTSLGLRRRYKKEDGKNLEFLRSLDQDLKDNYRFFFRSRDFGAIEKFKSLVKWIL